MSTEEQVSEPPPGMEDEDPEALSAPAHGNVLRGREFKRLIRKPVTLILGAIFALGAAAGLAVVSPVLAPVGLIGAMLITAGIVFAIADSKAEQAFFESYASRNGFALQGKHSIPGETPLLRKGDRRYASRSLTGTLAPGCEGMLVLFTYEQESRDSKGNKQTSYYRFTLTMTEVPEASRAAPKLRAQRKSGLKMLQGVEDAFRKDERIELESAALADRYEIFAGDQCDPNWLRQLFSPQFIVWMTDHAPEKFAFEYVAGTLVCYLPGHKEDAGELDAVRAAGAAVGARLREEALETP